MPSLLITALSAFRKLSVLYPTPTPAGSILTAALERWEGPCGEAVQMLSLGFLDLEGRRRGTGRERERRGEWKGVRERRGVGKGEEERKERPSSLVEKLGKCGPSRCGAESWFKTGSLTPGIPGPALATLSYHRI